MAHGNQDGDSMLALEQVRKGYIEPNGQPLPILDVERLEIGKGEQVVLRGRSGCGKTTLLNCIAGLSTVDSGTITIGSTEVTRLPEAGRDRFRAGHIGIVFQTFNLLPAFTALENVMLGMAFSGGKPDAGRARDLLAQVGLEHRLTHKPRALSVGEQQRVAVARALANKPVLLLADEPTANVDPAHQQQVIDLLRAACRRESIAMLLVTHATEVASQFERVEYLETINRAVKV
jgi:ABC-type lipoprotein export system ATPase subunit